MHLEHKAYNIRMIIYPLTYDDGYHGLPVGTDAATTESDFDARETR